MNRLYIDGQAFEIAMQYAVAQACTLAKSGGFDKIVFMTINNSHKKTIEDILSSYPHSPIVGAKRFVCCAVNYVVETIKGYRYGLNDILICCGLDSNEIFKVEKICGIAWNVVVKEYRSIDLWGRTWGVQGIQATGLSLPTYQLLFPSTKVQNALKQVSSCINLSNSFSLHPSDENLVKTYLLALNHYEPQPMNPDEVSAYLMRECGWNYNLAMLVHGYIETLNAGKYFKGGDRKMSVWKNFYSKW